MGSSKGFTLILICMLFISTITPILGCGHCGKPSHKPTKPKTHHSKHKPKLPVPPVTVPPITLPPILGPPSTPRSPCGVTCPPGPGTQPTCPIDALKLGACVDLLGGLIHIGLGDPAINQCCPILQGLVAVEAAVCLCTTLKLKLLNLNLYVPLALQLLLTCGKTPPPGFTCTL